MKIGKMVGLILFILVPILSSNAYATRLISRVGASYLTYDSDEVYEQRIYDTNRYGTLSEVNGTYYYDNNDNMGTVTSVSYSAKSLISDGNLKTSSSLSYNPSVADDQLGEEFQGFTEGVNFATTFPARFETRALARFSDSWTISGADDGTQGTLIVSYAVDGNSFSPSVNTEVVSSSTELKFSKSDIDTVINFGSNGGFDDIVDFEMDFIFGEQFRIGMEMTSLSQINFSSGDPFSVETFTDFFNTALLENIQAFDSSGSLIDFSLTSVSGTETFEQFSTLNNSQAPAPVPEPSAWVLMACGGAGLVWWGRKRKAV